ncbi:MAG: HAMP domain-containing protein [Gammaproteobacteria bacterium]|nr:HAMP domain-containing protein [Gammaproteobacteria bacterium]MDP6164840.1 ATP-binding protein [Gammaproteobacteria bacterium]
MSLAVELRDKLLPNSIFARMGLVLIVGIFVAQSLGTWLWVEQLKDSERKRLIEVSQNMGSRIGQTIQFFTKLPKQYQHIVLDQLRDMGGTRYFVSVNQAYIPLPNIKSNEFSELVSKQLKTSINAQMGPQEGLDIQFVKFNDLKILSGENRMIDLPLKWKRFALLEPNDQSPIVLVQLPIDDNWMYLATPVPSGSVLVGVNWLTTERLINISVVSLTVLILTLFLVRWVVRPFRLLARQAQHIGSGRKPQQLKEQGTREMVATVRAFNTMSKRIQKFINDRERLFAAISHDLKTPLTRARLRAEMLDDEATKEALIGDLENLDSMVKGSLQLVKEGIVHENPLQVAIGQMLHDLAEKEKIYGLPIDIDLEPNLQLEGRPMALERLFTNLIDNALEYGRAAYIRAWQDKQHLHIEISDPGPGLSDADKERVFEPYFRINQKPSSEHSGLGLSIARSIANFHGGELTLRDRAGGGLVVALHFPL